MSSEVTRILSAIEQGDPSAAEQLLPLVYAELRQLAALRLAQEKPGQTLEATALVHEAYLRLVGHDAQAEPAHWHGRAHFFAAAAEAMRRILVEQARRKARVRHGGDRRRVELEDRAAARVPDAETILAVEQAVARLAREDPQSAEVVKLHFFAANTFAQPKRVLAADIRSPGRRSADDVQAAAAFV